MSGVARNRKMAISRQRTKPRQWNKTPKRVSPPSQSLTPKVTHFDNRPGSPENETHHQHNGCCGGGGCGGRGCGGGCGRGCGGCGCGYDGDYFPPTTTIFYDQLGYPVYQSVPPLPTTCNTCPFGFQGYGGLPMNPFQPLPYTNQIIPAPPMCFQPYPPPPPMVPSNNNQCSFY